MGSRIDLPPVVGEWEPVDPASLLLTELRVNAVRAAAEANLTRQLTGPRKPRASPSGVLDLSQAREVAGERPQAVQDWITKGTT